MGNEAPDWRGLVEASRGANEERDPYADVISRGDRIADRTTALIGSWRFILVLVAILLAWMIVNTIAWMQHWDPYPFIFLNLLLSFQGAFAAPIILMSQNRQEERDRQAARRDHAINLRAEREIATLLDRMEILTRARETDATAALAEQQALYARIDRLLAALEAGERCPDPPA